MDHRLSLGGAALALVALPLAYQVYSGHPIAPRTVVAELPAGEEIARQPVSAPSAVPAPVPAKPTPARKQAAEAQDATPPPLSVPAQPAADAAVAAAQPAPPPPAMVMSETASAGETASAPTGAVLAARSRGTIAAAEPSGDRFEKFDESALKSVATDPVSTFSVDVDTASYAYVRASLDDGVLPPPDAVRIEEMINYFPYAYPAPATADVPFRVSLAVFPTPWNAKTELLRIGIKGYVPPAAEKKAQHLVFLVDTSGSMDEPNKLPLLRRAFALLVDSLGPKDTVAIVAYAGSAGVVLEPTRASDKAKVLSALDGLQAGGSTAGAEGIALAYRLAEQSKVEGTVNRVILATDGDFNVGISDPDELKDFIRKRRDDGITLSVLGFGRGNLDDALMQALAQNGNGNASYIDSYAEARKVLVEEAGGTLDMIAKDVKLQLEFNPAAVSEYRLIGYETRALNREDFNNDKVDAGDIGAGHTVTALYEITPKGKGGEQIDPLRYAEAKPAPATEAAPSDEFGFLKLRYKLPGSDQSRLIDTPIPRTIAAGSLDQADDDARFAAAVAAFGQKLKGSSYGDDMSWEAIRDLAMGARGKDEGGYRAEFLRLVPIASDLTSRR
ncbi:VWA domain-containing protein [Kaistia algarum]|uniref:VWA domain-containing protein n=1 Tax=Kaistia algarum TaxID=2083279 RepID=UPI002B1E0A7C|nr:VWA domain-containing protein [Kaistia algarum]